MLMWIVFILALLLGSMYFLRSVSPYLRNDLVWRDSKKTLFPKKDLVQGKSILNYQQALNQVRFLQAMQERMVNIDGIDYPLGAFFICFATQNPIEMEGTYPLPEAQKESCSYDTFRISYQQ